MFLSIILTLIVVGILLWAITKYIPMEPTIKNIVVGVVVIVTIIWLLKVFGIFDNILTVHA